MNVREKIETILVEMGMFQQQAAKVMDLVIPIVNDISDDYKVLWHEHWSFYEGDMYDFLLSIVKPEALKWIDENVPKAWFRDNFLD